MNPWNKHNSISNIIIDCSYHYVPQNTFLCLLIPFKLLKKQFFISDSFLKHVRTISICTLKCVEHLKDTSFSLFCRRCTVQFVQSHLHRILLEELKAACCHSAHSIFIWNVSPAAVVAVVIRYNYFPYSFQIVCELNFKWCCVPILTKLNAIEVILAAYYVAGA